MKKWLCSLALVLLALTGAEVKAGNFTLYFYKNDGTAITTPVTVTISPAADPTKKLVGPTDYASGATVPCAGTLLGAYTDKTVILTFTQGGVTSQIAGLFGTATTTQVLRIAIAVP
jgi:hypothetical protein